MEFKLPELGEGVHEGELVKWLVRPGDTVKHDQPICEIMTDKATVELPAPFDGKISELKFKEGQSVKVGAAILTYVATGEVKRTEIPAQQESLKVVDFEAAPIVRRRAREAEIDLAQVAASKKAAVGQSVRVTLEDLGGATAEQLEVREERIPFLGLRKKIAEQMRLSKDKAAHYTYVEEADATELVSIRAKAKEIGEKQGIKVTYLPFVIKAMVAALKRYPVLNSQLDEEKSELIYKHYYNVGLSVQTEEGLIAPVIKDIENRSILQIARDIEELVARTRSKRLSVADFKDGTITLTNAGSIGGIFATPIINYPQVAILGFNKIFKHPVVKVVDGKPQTVIRDWTYFSISLDHRIVDGAIAAQFMKSFVSYIENPTLLLLESR
ncbi:MAG: hypothetical protein A3K03_06680 [Bdellovibrionales bacterium RIFOXYD1_FULL_44_7]|nr:MAG: hypothetical protein A3K03_06680 [Bdellovibrionales bacterium RIFOXYD1_FULL_44_7]